MGWDGMVGGGGGNCSVSNILVLCQGISVLEQEKLDNTMIEMDGTDNKCKPQSYLKHSMCSDTFLHQWTRVACNRFCISPS